MTDQTMTHEQALADALDNLVHDNYERSYRGSQERKADADLIRAALSRPVVPEGYKLVPIEPTSAMKTAGCGVEVYQDSPAELEALTWEEAAAIWRAMLAAAPEPAEESLTTEQPEDGPVATWDNVAHCGFGLIGRCEHLANETPLYPESVKAERDALRERVKELADALELARGEIAHYFKEIRHLGGSWEVKRALDRVDQVLDAYLSHRDAQPQEPKR